MKILVPLNDTSVVKQYIDAGADEFYIGFYDEKWEHTFGKYADLNRMSGFKEFANKFSFMEMISVSQLIKSYGKSVYLTLNANCYSKEQIEFIEKNYICHLKDKVDGIIVSDLGLINIINKYGIKLIASTMCGIYNSDIAKVYSSFGINRMILPRDLTLDEIEMIAGKSPNIEIEVFFMRNGCIFSDAYCLGMHRKECGSTCSFVRNHIFSVETKFNSFEEKHSIEMTNYLYNNVFHNFACGLCALYRMKEIGISSLKIVGRADNYEAVCEDIRLTKINICVAKESKNEEQYLRKMILPKGAVKKCIAGYSCYYPEIRFGR